MHQHCLSPFLQKRLSSSLGLALPWQRTVVMAPASPAEWGSGHTRAGWTCPHNPSQCRRGLDCPGHHYA